MMNDVREYVGVTMREADDKGRVRLAFSPLASLALFFCAWGESSTRAPALHRASFARNSCNWINVESIIYD